MSSFSDILHLTDTHVGDAPDFRLWGLPVEALLLQVLADARSRFARFDQVLHTGDATHDAGPAALERLKARLAALGAPVGWTPGNHDLPEVMGGQPQAFDLPGWRVLLLSTRKPGAVEGRIDEASLAWLERELALACAPVLLAMHHPPLPTGTPWLDAIGLANAQELWGVIRRHTRVRAILHGHAHMEQTVLHEGVLVLGTPSTHGQFKPMSRRFALDTQAPGYRWLRLFRNGRLSSQVVRVDVRHPCPQA